MAVLRATSTKPGSIFNSGFAEVLAEFGAKPCADLIVARSENHTGRL